MQAKHFSKVFFKFLELLPLMLIAGLTGFSVVVVVLLLLGALYTWLIVVLGVPVATLLAALVLRHAKALPHVGSVKEARIVDVVVLIAIALWGGFNLMYASQHVFTDRDPATYGNTAVWLTKHNDLDIQPSYTEFGENEAITHASAGFALDDNGTVHSQGAHLLPVLLGIGGRVLGENALFRLGPFIGAIALLAVYAFARMFLLPRWALLAAGITAATLPMIYFSRGTYTEPLTMAFVFGSLAFFWLAQSKQRLLWWGLAGLVAGAATMTRIDAYLILISYAAILILWLALAKKSERKQRLLQTCVFSLAASVTGLLGWLDVMILSNPYYIAHVKLMMQIIAMLGAVIVFGLMLVAVSWKSSFVKKLDVITRRWRAVAIVLLLVAIGTFLASRPMWMIGTSDSLNSVVTSVQESEGLAIEARSYAEQSVNWLVWYLGIIVLIVGFIGMLRSSYEFLKGKKFLLGAGLAVIGVTAMLYLWRPNITPDHLWATRRYLPIVLPGFAIFAGYALQEFESRFLLKSRPLIKSSFFIVMSIACLLLPLLASKPFILAREKLHVGVVQDVCESLPENAAVVWVGMARLNMVQPTRTFCDLPTAGYDNGDKLTEANLQEIAASVRAEGRVPFIGGFGYQGGIFEVYGQLNNTSAFHSTRYHEIQSTLTKAPTVKEEMVKVILLAEINPDGSLKPIEQE